MTRTELVQKLALNMNYSKRKSGEIINAMLDGIILGVYKDGKTSIRNFGLFRIEKIIKSRDNTLVPELDIGR